MKTFIFKKLNIRLLIVMLFGISLSVFSQDDGKTLFKQNCGACHSLKEQVLVGPSLQGINDKRTEEWLIKWIKDSQKLIKEGDAEAKKIFDDYKGQVMPPFQQLSDDQIKSVLAFIKTPPQDDVVAKTDAVAKTVIPEAAPWSPLLYAFVITLFLVVTLIAANAYYLKYKLKSLGYYSGNTPFRDQVSNWFSKNGTFILIVVIAAVLLLMKSCIGALMQ